VTSFGTHLLPYGSFSTAGGARRVGVAVDDGVLDLTAAAPRLVPDHAALFAGGTLDAFLAAGRSVWEQVRSALLQHAAEEDLLPLADVVLHLPFTVADYVDFYASEAHATNVGRMFRPDSDPLPAAWKHLPIGYHGRAGTVVVSGTAVQRPQGLRRTAEGVAFGRSLRLDLEAEVGFVVGSPSELGTSVPVGAFADHVFGVCLVNDWSARDVQAFETVPLGPFLGKSFATSVSPWVVPLQALEHVRAEPPERDVPIAPYLDDRLHPWGLDLSLEVSINGTVVSRPEFRDMYWTGAQQLAHLTVNGASLRTGDLYASGTVSGPERDRRGCLLELSWNGTEPVALDDGTTRTFLEDGDVVVVRATTADPGGGVVHLGEVRGTVVPASEAAGSGRA